MKKSMLTMAFGIAMITLLFQCGPDEKTKKLMADAKTTFGPIPKTMPGQEHDTQAMIQLGEKLYHEKKLSINDTMSCNTCHNVLDGGPGVDNTKFSPGALPNTVGDRNAPTVWNAGFHIAQFWDGREATLADQAKGPILNPVEMAMPDSDTVIKKLEKIPEYNEMFAKAFPNQAKALTYDNLATAIGAFERTLRTSDRFDDFMNGNASALNAEEIKGLELFLATGCATCHNGPLLGANSFRKIGERNPFSNTVDKGRFNFTKKEQDKFLFKVQSLRNVAKTAPYFHDSSAATLEEAVKEMAFLQLDKKLSEDEAKSIVAFLNSLTGKSIK